MKIKGYVISGLFLILIVYFLYWTHFSDNLQYKTSDNPEVWGQFGDYVGGVLNPFLSFISIALLIKSLNLQNEANQDLKSELKSNEKTEKLRSFEVLFFNLLDAQKNLFSSFELSFQDEDRSKIQLTRARAVIALEDRIEAMRESGRDNDEIAEYLSSLDADDQIFGIVRGFYVAVSTVSDKLSDSQGFSIADREAHFRALVNFTDFSQLRLVLISVQFLDFHSTRYIRASIEFAKIVEELGLSHDQY